jgi:hypothetical protein
MKYMLYRCFVLRTYPDVSGLKKFFFNLMNEYLQRYKLIYKTFFFAGALFGRPWLASGDFYEGNFSYNLHHRGEENRKLHSDCIEPSQGFDFTPPEGRVFDKNAPAG